MKFVFYITIITYLGFYCHDGTQSHDPLLIVHSVDRGGDLGFYCHNGTQSNDLLLIVTLGGQRWRPGVLLARWYTISRPPADCTLGGQR